jgi:tetratricopeptide (TPR) repeat protein
LLAGDGQPMLLDFHLARAPLSAGVLADGLGGTPPYTAPEQREAMERLSSGQAPRDPVDHRADIYALGALLQESLGGGLPIEQADPLPGISRGLRDIIARATAPLADDRYPDAAALADDLRRHLTDQPLAGVRNASVGERWRKWRRRRPAALRTIALLLTLLAVVGILAGVKTTQVQQRREQAREALRDGIVQIERADWSSASATLGRGIELLRDAPSERALHRELSEQLRIARGRLLAAELHKLADDVRVLYAVRSVPGERLEQLARRCAEVEVKRDLITGVNHDPTVVEDLDDLAHFAREIVKPSASLPSTRPKPRTAREHYQAGRALLAHGDVNGASEHLRAAVALDPAGLWPNFYHGVCCYRQGRHQQAIAAMSVCIGAAPHVPACYYNRGLAYFAAGDHDAARRDFDRALALDPGDSDAKTARALIKP